jgi:hypothetical protein
MSDTETSAEPPVNPDVPTVEVDEPTSTVFDPSLAMRVLLASLSFGAGAIHLAMVPAHAKESMFMGVSFALSGWFAIIFGAIILARPTRLWVRANIAVNLVLIGTWAVSRTVGLPAFTGDPGVEKAASIDIMCVAFEAMVIVGCIAVLMAPDMLRSLKQGALVVAGIIPVAILVATTGVMASPSVADHGHDNEVAAGGGMDHSGGAMDHDAAGAMDHAAGGAMDHSQGNTAAAVPVASRCDWDMNTAAFWKQDPPATSGPAGSHSEHSHSNSTGGTAEGQGNSMGAQAWGPLTDQSQCHQLTTDVATMKAIALKYPTAADAKAAGCIQVTTYVPGIASHWACLKNWDNNLDLNNPEMLLYGGSSLAAPIVGLSYYSLAPTAPADDAGAPLWIKYMPSHYHEGLCVKNALVIGGDNSDAGSCEAKGGKVMGKTGWMGHYWLPTCDSPDGVFSGDNPRLDVGVAQYNDNPANQADAAKLQANPCAGSKLPTSPDDKFGPPDTAGTTSSGESAAGH